MKIATFNINNVNSRLPNLLAWLRAAEPDVVCLQELKAAEPSFPSCARARPATARCGAARRPGTASPSWRGAPSRSLTRTELPGDPTTGRRATSKRRSRASSSPRIYLPNGNPQPGPKFDYKLAWFERLRRTPPSCSEQASRWSWPATTMSCPPSSTSIRPNPGTRTRCCSRKPRRVQGACSSRAGPTPSARCIRTKPIYTFWDYKRNRWPRDAGLRLDHLLLSPALAPRLSKAGVDREVRGEEGASDHAPAWIVLR